MKFSEAIRLGAMMKPQAFGTTFGVQLVKGWRGWLLRRTEATTCAFAAALDAQPCRTKMIETTKASAIRGLTVKDGLMIEAIAVPNEWRVIYVSVPCPVCAGFNEQVFFLISHLNDTHRWTRERIADWVETLESATATNAVDPHVESEGTPTTRA